MEFTWSLHGVYMEFTWSLHGVYMEFTWSLHDLLSNMPRNVMVFGYMYFQVHPLINKSTQLAFVKIHKHLQINQEI